MVHKWLALMSKSNNPITEILNQLLKNQNLVSQRTVKILIIVTALIVGACQILPSLSGGVKNSTTDSHGIVSQNVPFKKGSKYSAKVHTVSDGDTVRVTDTNGAEHKIRLAFIDAPEKKQKAGLESLEALKALILDKQINVEVTDVDRYQREVGRLTLGNDDINFQQILKGNAWHYKSLDKRKDGGYQQYENAEQQAREQKLGLWQYKNPQAPWEWRKQQRLGQSSNQEE